MDTKPVVEQVGCEKNVGKSTPHEGRRGNIYFHANFGLKVCMPWFYLIFFN
jgi:hypothetical protein